jgi:glycosyltransferase, family 1
MKKVLHIIHGLNLGGAENFIYNLLKAVDQNQYRFDFAIQEPEIKHTEFKKLIEAKGGKIIVIPDFLHNPIGQIISLRRILRNGYDYVHIHINAFINPLPAIVASHADCKVIIHSHSTQNGKGGIAGKLVHRMNKGLFLKRKFIRLACSNEAGEWMYDKRSFQVIPNAIDISIYQYNAEYRRKIRERYGLRDEYIIGQVGRLIPLKNQAFSLRIFSKLKQKAPQSNFKIMFAGDGPEKQTLMDLAKQLHIEDDVIFAGAVHDINEYYSAFDILIMPSWFEGLGLVYVEAQAAGLQAIVSDTVPMVADVSGSVIFLSLKDKDQWVEALTQNTNPYNRRFISDKINGSEFDSHIMVERMCEIYK